eukprot:9181805-Heterocapsa_arctica.AAC.1
MRSAQRYGAQPGSDPDVLRITTLTMSRETIMSGSLFLAAGFWLGFLLPGLLAGALPRRCGMFSAGPAGSAH